VDRQEQVGTIVIGHGGALVQAEQPIVVAREHDADRRICLLQRPAQAAGQSQRDLLLQQARGSHGALLDPAVPGIENDDRRLDRLRRLGPAAGPGRRLAGPLAPQVEDQPERVAQLEGFVALVARPDVQDQRTLVAKAIAAEQRLADVGFGGSQIHGLGKEDDELVARSLDDVDDRTRMGQDDARAPLGAVDGHVDRGQVLRGRAGREGCEDEDEGQPQASREHHSLETSPAPWILAQAIGPNNSVGTLFAGRSRVPCGQPRGREGAHSTW
jgi:hypothetical protein